MPTPDRRGLHLRTHRLLLGLLLLPVQLHHAQVVVGSHVGRVGATGSVALQGGLWQVASNLTRHASSLERSGRQRHHTPLLLLVLPLVLLVLRRQGRSTAATALLLSCRVPAADGMPTKCGREKGGHRQQRLQGSPSTRQRVLQQRRREASRWRRQRGDMCRA